MTHRKMLLTGATGIMGSWVLGESLRRGYRCIVLMRDQDPNRAHERIKSVLDHVHQKEASDRVHIIHGDASLPNFGLNDSEYTRLRDETDMVVHCAACTSFNPEKDQECIAVNIGGVANVLHFLDGTDIPFYHVSTAYVVGKLQGVSLETELSRGQDFNNTYERSKCEAEQLVREYLDNDRICGAVFRPSIIVGSMKDGRILQFMNFYNLLRFIDILTSRRFSRQEMARMPVSPQGTKNIIPVDWAVKAMWHIIEHTKPDGSVYHLTNPKPIPHTMILDWANSRVKPGGLRFELVGQTLEKPSSIEVLAMSGFTNYVPYMGLEPVFDRTNTDTALAGACPFPDITPEHFDLFLDFARSHNWRSLFDARNATIAHAAQVISATAPVDTTGSLLPCDAGAPA